MGSSKSQYWKTKSDQPVVAEKEDCTIASHSLIFKTYLVFGNEEGMKLTKV